MRSEALSFRDTLSIGQRATYPLSYKEELPLNEHENPMAPNNPQDPPDENEEDLPQGFAELSNSVNPDEGLYDFKDDGEEVGLSDSFDSSNQPDPTDIYDFKDDGNDNDAPSFSDAGGADDIYEFKDDGGDVSFQDDYVHENKPDAYDTVLSMESDEISFSDVQSQAKDPYEFREGTPRSRQDPNSPSAPMYPREDRSREPQDRGGNPRLPGSGAYKLPGSGSYKLPGSGSYQLPGRQTGRMGPGSPGAPAPGVPQGGTKKRNMTRRMPRTNAPGGPITPSGPMARPKPPAGQSSPSGPQPRPGAANQGSGVPRTSSGRGTRRVAPGSVPPPGRRPSRVLQQPPLDDPNLPPPGRRPSRVLQKPPLEGDPRGAPPPGRRPSRVLQKPPFADPNHPGSGQGQKPPARGPRPSGAHNRPPQPGSGAHRRPMAPPPAQRPVARGGPTAKQTHRIPKDPTGQRLGGSAASSYEPKSVQRPTRSTDDEDPPFPIQP